jgi:uncharacterized membrane protein YwzB
MVVYELVRIVLELVCFALSFWAAYAVYTRLEKARGVLAAVAFFGVLFLSLSMVSWAMR